MAAAPVAVVKRREGLRFPPRAAPGPSPPRALSSLPLSRVKLIMKSCPDVSSINQDALFLTAKATEQFVQYLALYAYKSSKKDKKELTYNDLADCVENSETFQFLADILPKKILASEYLKMLEEERAGGGDRDEEDGDEEDDEEEDDNNEQDEDEDENES
ncbi:chromatin accessibility complex protein 1 [Callorhinchus milii]|uniref:Chromatin accessibility complex protein 1 n=1 Tax=Callorhinchus milii TaxID=7868 RepID=V9L3E0_CALMI|nr:chromatin accessibility complex protein 1 [Callorhinchus milii]|eukprot:gi/632959147/ref/XP_007895456.1/ PREDICTED: chromatin accessibility complex protein 1 [Callorhinchus milii]